MAKLCANPLWPCAMTGAASALAGIKDLGVIIHGSSGCYIYADMAVSDTLYSTFLVQDEVIFGTSDRLLEVVESISELCGRVAVINTCVPSVMGEDISGTLSEYDCITVDIAGFKGDFDYGWKSAVSALKPTCDPEKNGVNIEGICSLDPYSRGNLNEAERLLHVSEIPKASVFFKDTYNACKNPSCTSISANPDYNTDVSKVTYSILGLKETEDAFEKLSNQFPEANTEPVFNLTEEAEEIMRKAGEKFLRRNDSPRAAVFSTKSYSKFACDILKNYLDAEIVTVNTRNDNNNSDNSDSNNLREIVKKIDAEKPDIILGSSFEYAKFPKKPFFGLTFPIRHQKMLWHRPLCGVEGSLYFMDSVLNSLESKR
ncbi:nitrogenase component 1 [Methanomicrobium antiquum]|uniref:Nitrogenase component 1 n=1 Tax=Methanomicrobium antiquum TaxID=487686 RepID=A0AAF0FWA0_9EURY|nr:nitrogenase component 1 [Methanomicrobium antiquum]WFN37115.1 nitrogenase component 1 [Methanomicrobium antiquum]